MNAHQILIAEDNPVTLDLLRFNLERAGFEVTSASSGSQALNIAMERTFDCIMTDFQMPGLDGESLSRRLQKSGANQETPIVLCTAKGFEINKDALRRECGITEFLNKPFSPRQAVELVRGLISAESTAGSPVTA